MKHLDLFSGIGGFALALDQVVDATHVFCDNDKFCQEVLKKNFPNTKIYDDIKQITNESADIITGGFPCQPFSQAGKRRGTADDRYLWPEMFRVIQLAKPTWVLAENVGGLLTWDEGMVLEQVCTDLEAEGYEVQPFIIPAVAKNAPHRRDRVWIIGYSQHNGLDGSQDTEGSFKGSNSNTKRQDTFQQLTGSDISRDYATDTNSEGLQRFNETKNGGGQPEVRTGRRDWNDDWLEVAAELCRVDDGLPNRVDRIKALGNAIVPQVAEEIMRGMFF
jgi:DNA (cytosine-5)-methyltransferase 1